MNHINHFSLPYWHFDIKTNAGFTYLYLHFFIAEYYSFFDIQILKTGHLHFLIFSFLLIHILPQSHLLVNNLCQSSCRLANLNYFSLFFISFMVFNLSTSVVFFFSCYWFWLFIFLTMHRH